MYTIHATLTLCVRLAALERQYLTRRLEKDKINRALNKKLGRDIKWTKKGLGKGQKGQEGKKKVGICAYDVWAMMPLVTGIGSFKR
jgi:hypothetical protein